MRKLLYLNYSSWQNILKGLKNRNHTGPKINVWPYRWDRWGPLSNLITQTSVHALNRKDTAKKIDLACKMEARTKSQKIHISEHVLKKNCPVLHPTLKHWRLTWLLTWGSCSVLSDSLRLHGLYSLPGSSVHGILQRRILEWVAIPFSRGSSWLRDKTLRSLT